MDFLEEHVRPVAERFSRWRWFGVSIVVGFFLGFIDTLMLAAVMGSLGIVVPAYVGVPTTLTGYFFAGMALARFAPVQILWEIPAGILTCSFLLVWGLFGLHGHSIGAFIFNFVFIPGIAMGVCYLGVLAGRGKLKEKLFPGKSKKT